MEGSEQTGTPEQGTRHETICMDGHKPSHSTLIQFLWVNAIRVYEILVPPGDILSASPDPWLWDPLTTDTARDLTPLRFAEVFGDATPDADDD